MRGKAYNLLDDYENAISDFNVAQELLTPENNRAEILLNRANAYLALNDYSRALRDYSNLKIDKLENDDLKASAYFGRSICRLNLNKEQDLVLTELSKAIALDQKFFEAYMIQAKLYSEKNDYHGAVEILSEALEVAAEGEELAQLHNLRGIYLSEQGKIEESIKDFTKAIKYKSSICDYHFNRGLSYFSTGNFSEAMQDFNEAVKINPHYAEAYNAKGSIYLHFGKHKQAVKVFTMAIKFWGNNKERVRAIRNKILCLVELEQISKAEELLTEVLELDPHHPFTDYVKLKLKNAQKRAEGQFSNEKNN